MTSVLITSDANPKYKQLRNWMTDSRHRRKDGVLIVEGAQFVTETLRHCPGSVEVLIRNDASPAHATSVSDVPIWSVSNGLYRALSSLGPSDGLIAVCRRPELGAPPLEISRLVVLDQIQNPENLGAIVRSAAAFGWDGIAITPGTCDPFHPDAIRAMAGNWYQTPIYTISSDWIDQWDGVWVMLDVDAKRELGAMSSYPRLSVVIGSEGRGITCDWFNGARAVETVRIPMVPGVESLNAAVSAGIVLYYVSNKELH